MLNESSKFKKHDISTESKLRLNKLGSKMADEPCFPKKITAKDFILVPLNPKNYSHFIALSSILLESNHRSPFFCELPLMIKLKQEMLEKIAKQHGLDFFQIKSQEVKNELMSKRDVAWVKHWSIENNRLEFIKEHEEFFVELMGYNENLPIEERWLKYTNLAEQKQIGFHGISIIYDELNDKFAGIVGVNPQKWDKQINEAHGLIYLSKDYQGQGFAEHLFIKYGREALTPAFNNKAFNPQGKYIVNTMKDNLPSLSVQNKFGLRNEKQEKYEDHVKYQTQSQTFAEFEQYTKSSTGYLADIYLASQDCKRSIKNSGCIIM
jgi:RimJ/RimL family protein N-acetyltransferase